MTPINSSFSQTSNYYPQPLEKKAASLNEQWRIVEEHLKLDGLQIDQIDRSRQTPLTFAVIKNNPLLCRKLIDSGADLEAKDGEGQSPLSLATIDLMPILLGAGANVNGTFQRLPLLLLAAMAGNLKACEILLNHGVDIDKTDEGPLSPLFQDKDVDFPSHILEQGIGCTALMMACQKGDLEIAELLLSRGASSSFGNLPPLYFAVINGSEELCLLLRKYGADPNVSTPLEEGGLLHLFVGVPNNEMPIKLLLKLEADINRQDEKGRTPLHDAVVLKSLQTVKLLIELGADVNKEDKKGRTPLHDAVVLKSLEIMALLKARKADPNKQDKKGRTPLHLATRSLPYDPECIQSLFDQGARADVMDTRGYTPMLNIYLKNVQFLQNHKKMMVQDGSLTPNLLAVRLLGHRFSLPGKIFSKLGQKATFFDLAKKIDYYIRGDLLNRSWLFYAIPVLDEAVNQSLTAKHYAEKVRRGEIVALEAGTVSHAISVVLYNEYIAIGNRGFRGINEKPEIKIFKIQAFESLENVINSLLLGGRDPLKDLPEVSDIKIHKADIAARQQELMRFFEKDIRDILGLQQEYVIKLKEQKSENCGWAAAKMTLRSMLTFSHLSPERRPESLEEAAFVSRPTYKDVVEFDRRQAFYELPDLAPFKKNVAFDDFFRDLAFSCAKRGREDMFQSILGARPELVNVKNPFSGNNLLYKATRKWADNLVLFLLQRGADHAFKDSIGFTSLHLAAFCGRNKIAEHLLEYGAQIEERTAEGSTPLIYAAEKSQTEMVEFLLAQGANPKAANFEGWTALHFACKEGNLEICQELIKREVDLKAMVEDGSTPLTLAISNKRPAIVKLLLASGIQPDEAALELACTIGNQEILALLKVN